MAGPVNIIIFSLRILLPWTRVYVVRSLSFNGLFLQSFRLVRIQFDDSNFRLRTCADAHNVRDDNKNKCVFHRFRHSDTMMSAQCWLPSTNIYSSTIIKQQQPEFLKSSSSKLKCFFSFESRMWNKYITLLIFRTFHHPHSERVDSALSLYS